MIEIGNKASFRRRITEEDVLKFAEVSGDFNPIHFDEDYARTTMFGGRIVHGMLVASFISSLLSERLPGPGSIYLSQALKFLKPVRVGDTLVVFVEVIDVRNRTPKPSIIKLNTFIDREEERILEGEAVMMMPED